jgi:hypothetical protein
MTKTETLPVVDVLESIAAKVKDDAAAYASTNAFEKGGSMVKATPTSAWVHATIKSYLSEHEASVKSSLIESVAAVAGIKTK